MKNIKRWKVTIKGISPLIWNRMKRELELEKGKLKKDQLNEWEEKNWKRKSEFDEKKNVLVPNEWIKSCLIDSCKKTRLVPHFATTKSQTYTNYMIGTMIMNMSPVGKLKDLQYYGAYVGGQGKGSTTKVWRVRPMLKDWVTTFEWNDPFGRMQKKELKELLEYAGYMIGVGDNRFNNFGRFEIVEIKEMNT